MTSLDSSLVYWSDEEILPRNIFVTTSGSGGDRLLFCQPARHMRIVRTHEEGMTTQPPYSVYRRSSEPESGCKTVVPTETKSPVEDRGTTALTVLKSNNTINPFGLNLLMDRSNEASFSAFGHGLSASDRISVGGTAGTIASVSPAHHTDGTAGNSGHAFTHSIGDVFPCTGVERSRDQASGIEVNELSGIDDLPATLILSLLHQQFHGLQKKLYIKVGHLVFVGATFNINSTTDDMDQAAEEATADSRPSRIMISFSIVFTMDASAPPSVLSHYTELGRMVAAQLRRAELISNYVTQQRDLIVSDMDHPYRNSGLCVSSNSIEHTTEQVILGDHSQTYRRPQRACSLNDNARAPGGPVEWGLLQSATETTADDATKSSIMNSESFYDRLVRISSLCGVLRTIIDSVCSTGHVNVMINEIHPVFFCLPHKAYCVPQGMTVRMPAIRPKAIWRAMDKIRPYHSVLLLRRKRDLIDKYLPCDINPSLVNFVRALSPTVNLRDLAVQIQSQMHCLTLTLWLLYRGHALIAYPIAATNTYCLSPCFSAWFAPSLITQFTCMFPTVNLAQLLSSFSTTVTLNEHSQTVATENKVSISNPVSSVSNASSEDSGKFWLHISHVVKVELITWLLRHRLIVQVHMYVFSTLTRETLIKTNQTAVETIWSSSVVAYDNLPTLQRQSQGLQDEQPLTTDDDLTIDKLPPNRISSRHISQSLGNRLVSYTNPATPSEPLQAMTINNVPLKLVKRLRESFDPDLQETALEVVLNHPGATQNLVLLRLFARLLPRLPAHLEELMFVEGISRAQLMECIERFSPLLSTAQLPDPVTACFAGVDWPE